MRLTQSAVAAAKKTMASLNLAEQKAATLVPERGDPGSPCSVNGSRTTLPHQVFIQPYLHNLEMSSTTCAPKRLIAVKFQITLMSMRVKPTKLDLLNLQISYSNFTYIQDA